MTLGIVVVTHDSAASLRACLEGIGPVHLPSTLVVDNGSSDESVAIARACGARVLARPENAGFGRAASQGAREVGAESLCFLNPDCEPTPGLFEAGLRALDGHPRRCAAPELVEPRRAIPGSQPGYTRTKLVADLVESHYGRRASRWLRRLPSHDDASWRWPHGACFFIGRAFFEELGGFDPRYFLYMEDVDLGRRIALSGGEVVSLPCRVIHRGSGGSGVSGARRRALLDAGRIDYARRVYGHVFAGLLRASVLPAAWSRRVRGSER